MLANGDLLSSSHTISAQCHQNRLFFAGPYPCKAIQKLIWLSSGEANDDDESNDGDDEEEEDPFILFRSGDDGVRLFLLLLAIVFVAC